MPYILQVDFEMAGPFDGEMAPEFRELTESINQDGGFKKTLGLNPFTEKYSK